METFICHPERGGPYPAVFLLMDAPGIREELRDMARRLGTIGYYVLLPNLYYRAGRDTIFGPDVLEQGSAERERMRAVRTKMTIPPVMDDIASMLEFVDGQEAAKQGPVGAHGYCMSGPYALAAAARYPDRVAAAASFYGTWLVSDAEESPHLNLGKVKGELYISCAEHDELAPLPMVEELRGLFARAGSPGEIELQPGVHHGFAFPQRWCYDKPAAERHWERLIALYRRRSGLTSHQPRLYVRFVAALGYSPVAAERRSEERACCKAEKTSAKTRRSMHSPTPFFSAISRAPPSCFSIWCNATAGRWAMRSAW